MFTTTQDPSIGATGSAATASAPKRKNVIVGVIAGLAPVSYTHLTLPTIYSV